VCYAEKNLLLAGKNKPQNAKGSESHPFILYAAFVFQARAKINLAKLPKQRTSQCHLSVCVQRPPAFYFIFVESFVSLRNREFKSIVALTSVNIAEWSPRSHPRHPPLLSTYSHSPTQIHAKPIIDIHRWHLLLRRWTSGPGPRTRRTTFRAFVAELPGYSGQRWIVGGCWGISAITRAAVLGWAWWVESWT